MVSAESPATVLLALRRTASGHWYGLAARERAVSAGALVVIASGLLWGLAIAPALNTLRQSEVQQRRLDSQWQQMRHLEAEARTLQAQRPIARDAALRALQDSVKSTLGTTAELTVTADRATLTLKNTPAQALSLWLRQARTDAHAVPAEARLQRGAAVEASPSGVPVKPALSTMPGTGVMPAGGIMPGVGTPAGSGPPPGDAMVASPRAAAPPSATWSGTLLLNLP